MIIVLGGIRCRPFVRTSDPLLRITQQHHNYPILNNKKITRRSNRSVQKREVTRVFTVFLEAREPGIIESRANAIELVEVYFSDRS
jgi:hypothetical protein